MIRCLFCFQFNEADNITMAVAQQNMVYFVEKYIDCVNLKVKNIYLKLMTNKNQCSHSNKYNIYIYAKI